ncbi:MAG: UvrD-helicase domain-containing protein [Thermoleophilia bacterium]|jgi:ATP-dependent helicase/nuclease subunit A
MSYLDDIGLSDAQRAAVLDDSARALVAAGAGSGKTTLLVAYFVHALLDDHIPLDELVAVTFTRKAAGELVSRIRCALEEQKRPDLARSLDTGAIGTIHSLCRRILRRYALDAGVDPAFGVLEADAAGLLQREAALQVWEDAVEQAGDSELPVLARHEKVLRGELVPLYNRLRGVGYEVPQVSIAAGQPYAEVRARFEESVRCALDACLALPRRTATVETALDTMTDGLQWVATIDPEETDPDRLSQSMALSSAYFPRRIAAVEGHLEPVREALTACRTCLAQGMLQPLTEAMNGLLARLHDRYQQLKRARGVLDFADLELRTRALLTRDNSVLPPIFGSRSRVMIDEFQDTNELQCSILEGLGAANLLMVGDERQSIYRFRGADVDVFVRRQAALTPNHAAVDTGKGTPHSLIPHRPTPHRLDVNYRSRAEVLAFINSLFAHEGFFGSRFVALEYGRDAKETIPCSTEKRPLPTGPAVELLVVERTAGPGTSDQTPSIQEVEAEATAARVARLLSVDGCEPREIVILMPALTHVERYRQALRGQSVDAYVVRGKGYYSREEVADIRSLLRLLLDPHDDVALVGVLRSPFVELSDDGLYLLGREACSQKADSLWRIIFQGDCPGLSCADRRALTDLRHRLAELRGRVGRPGLAGLIDRVIDDFDYDLRVLASEDGRRRFANIRKLMRLADEFEALHGPDVAGFVEAVEMMRDIGDQEGSAATLAEGENVVRIMTIHQAKGLEFPVVILTGLGSDVPRGGHPSFVVDSRGRMGVFLKDSRRTTYEDHDLCWGPAVEIVEEERVKEEQEDVRLLYVAMTRAEERLLLVGARPKGDKLTTCRLGRIILALGLTSLPETGENIALPALDAVVCGVACDARSSDGDGGQLDCAGGRSERLDAEKLDAERLGTERFDTVSVPAEGAGQCPSGGMEQVVEGGGEASAPLLHFLEARSVGRVPHRLSFSGLSFYLDCPRRFYLERVLGLDLESDPGLEPGVGAALGRTLFGEFDDEVADDSYDILDQAEAHTGREVGLLVHALLERVSLHEPMPGLSTLRAMAAGLTSGDGREQGGGGPLAPGGLSSVAFDRALHLTQAFWSSPVVERAGLAHALKEAPFTFLQGDMLISGVMDLVWREGEAFSIVDYKTNALAGRALSEVAASYELQVALYCLVALKAGAAEVRMDLLFLECPKEPVVWRYGEDDISALEQTVDEVLSPLRCGEYPPNQGPRCVQCSLAEVCAHLL